MEQSWHNALREGYVRTSPAHQRPPSRLKHPLYTHNYAHHFSADLNRPVLDIGIGCGDLLLFWKDLGFSDIWGIDINTEPVEICKRAFPEMHIVQVESTAVFLSAHPRRFFLIAMFDVLEHLKKEEMFAVLSGGREALAPGGRLVIQTINAANLFQTAGRYCDITHEQSFTETSLRQIFQLAGFRSITVGPVETALPNTGRRALKRVIRALYHRTLRFAYRLDDGNAFEVMTPLIKVIASE